MKGGSLEDKIIAEGLAKNYKEKKVVKNCSLSISKGEVVGLLGPNGAGKTTSFYMICGLIAPSQGKIWLGEKDITHLSIDQRANWGLGYLPQEPSIFRDLSVEDNIYAILELKVQSKGQRQERLKSLIKDFGLEKVCKTKGRSLSGGERRRVEIARTLALDPHFVLLDEPFAGVDPLAVKEIQLIVEKLKKSGIGILMTDHNVRETLGIVDRSYIMVDGEILFSGTPNELRNNQKAKELYLGDTFKT